MINEFPVVSEGRQPRGIFTINDDIIPFESFTATNNNVYEADTFRALIALSAAPTGIDASYFAKLAVAQVKIYAGFPANPAPGGYTTNDLDTIFVGQIDNLEIDPITNCVDLVGRDLTAKFIDTKTTEKFQNQTASQVVTLLANRQGLTPVVTPTTTPVGIFYQNNNTVIASEKTEWDLLVFLAQQEGFLIFVDGNKLVFEPIPPESNNPYLAAFQAPTTVNGSPQCNVIKPKFTRSLTVAKDVIVKVRSWNRGNKQSYTATVTATHNIKTAISGKAQPVGRAETFSYVKGGLTKQQALQLAQQKMKEITQQEINFSFSNAAVNTLKKNSIIKTQGFADGLNQVFYPDNITRTMINAKNTTGYHMRVNSKNHSPISTVIA